MKALTLAAGLLSLVALAGCSQQGGSANGAQGDVFRDGIIGGKPVPHDTIVGRSTVAVYDLARGALCTGSIISKNIILTAAHCVQGGSAPNYRVIFGTELRGQDKIVRKVLSMKYNAKWSGDAKDGERDLGDIAVIKIEGTTLPVGFEPAKLLSDSALITDGTKVLLAGYGLTDGTAKTGEGTLRYAVVTIQDAAFSKTEIELDQSNGAGACHGDSGGPAYIKGADGKLTLFGITSRGENDANDTCGGSAVYTNAAAYKPWLKTAISAMNRKKGKAASTDIASN